MKQTIFSRKFVHRFLFPFSTKFSIFTHVMKPVRDTNSEPGLPVGIVERAKRKGAWKSPHARKGKLGGEREFFSPSLLSRVGGGGGRVFHARQRFARSTILEEKLGLLVVQVIWT